MAGEETNDQAEGLGTDMAQLRAIAAAQDAVIDGASVIPGANQDAAEPEQDRPAELAAMLTMGVAMLAPALPFLPQCYTPEVCQQIGTAFDAVAEKHGWNLDAISSPELALAVVSVPPTVAAVMMARAHFAAKRAADKAADERRTVDMPATKPNPSGHAGHVLQPGAVA